MWLSMQMNGGSFGYTPKPASEFPWMLKLLGDEPSSLILMRYEPADTIPFKLSFAALGDESGGGDVRRVTATFG